MRAAVIFCWLLLAVFSANAQTKRAFVVGVGNYAELTDLQKTVGDAEGYAGVFRDDLGFRVTQLLDPTTEEFLAALDQFKSSIEPGDQVVFVFSGHGWSDGSQNYLALRDAPEQSSEFILKRLTVALQSDILDELLQRKPGLVFAVIDACRDNPFDLGTKSVTKGLVVQQTVPGTLVVYAAGARQQALDRLSPGDPSPYSVFTRSLLPKLKDADMPLMESVDEARSETAELAMQVSHAQRPAIYSDVSLRFCFSGHCRTGGNAELPVAPLNGADAAFEAWKKISSSRTPDDYTVFANQYPGSAFAPLALTRALRLQNGEHLTFNAGPYIVFFDENSETISEEAKLILDASLVSFRQNGAVSGVNIIGHASDKESREGSAYALGLRRAAKVRDYYIAGGVPKQMIQSLSAADYSRRVSEKDTALVYQNQRVEIMFH